MIPVPPTIVRLPLQDQVRQVLRFEDMQRSMQAAALLRGSSQPRLKVSDCVYRKSLQIRKQTRVYEGSLSTDYDISDYG